MRKNTNEVDVGKYYYKCSVEKAGHKQVGVYISIGKLEELIHYLLTQEKPKSVERKLLAVVM